MQFSKPNKLLKIVFIIQVEFSIHSLGASAPCYTFPGELDDQHQRLATETIEQEKELKQLQAFEDALRAEVEALEASNKELNSTTPGYLRIF